MARPLHHREGLSLVDPHSRPEPIPRVPLGDATADRALLVATPFFALERIALSGDTAVRLAPVASPQVLTPVAGAVLLEASGWVGSATTGETVILPAGREATLSARPASVVMRGWVPDLEREVIAPARAAGASDAALRSLGVPLPDMVDPCRGAARERVQRSEVNSC
jgi:mannose-6-phosphate isomerase